MIDRARFRQRRKARRWFRLAESNAGRGVAAEIGRQSPAYPPHPYGLAPVPCTCEHARRAGFRPAIVRIPAPTLYEEYHPFGTSSYRAADSLIEVSAKRYRYIGKERDEETGLYYCEARYYAAWLGRWTASDPIGLQGGINRYSYSNNNPVKLSDPGGMAPPQEQQKLHGVGQVTVQEGETARQAVERGLQEGFVGLDPSEASQVAARLGVTRKGDGEGGPKAGDVIDIALPDVALQAIEKAFDARPRQRSEERIAPGFIEGRGEGKLSPTLAKAAEVAAVGLKVLDIGLTAFGLTALAKAGVKLAGERALLRGAEKGLVAEETKAISGTARLASGKAADTGLKSSNELMGVEPASEKLLQAVGARRSVAIAQPGSEEMRYLDYIGAEANVGGATMEHILLRPNPSKAAVLEEFLHGTQQRLGIIDRLGTVGAETHVKDFMIRHQRLLGLSDEDVRILQILKDAGL